MTTIKKSRIKELVVEEIQRFMEASIKKLSINDAVKRFESWTKLAKKHGFETSDYKIVKKGKDRFELYIDGEVYSLINDYFSDGYNPGKLGDKFDSLFVGTNWDYERYSPSRIDFYKEEM